MTIEVTREALDAMEAAGEAAGQAGGQAGGNGAFPQEACGILLGRHLSGERSIIDALAVTRNVHPAPATHFEIDNQALIDTHRSMRAGGPAILGYFHSHPGGPAEPSPTDQAMSARDGAIWAIAGKEGVRLWRDTADGFRPLSYDVARR
jgi:proteasome lid subunit RPN8/RPN11